MSERHRAKKSSSGPAPGAAGGADAQEARKKTSNIELNGFN